MKTEHEIRTQKHMKNIPYTVGLRRILQKKNLQWAKEKNTMWKIRWNWWISLITIKILIWGLFIKLHKIKKKPKLRNVKNLFV